MATAITDSTTGRRSDLRTIVVETESVQSTVVLLPAGRLDVVVAKMLCGTTSRCDFWTQELGLSDPHSFAVPQSSVVQIRQMKIATVVKNHK